MGVFKRKYKIENGETAEVKNWSCEFFIDTKRFCKTIKGSDKFSKKEAEKQCAIIKQQHIDALNDECAVKFEDGMLAYYQDYARKNNERASKTHKKINDKYCYIVPMLCEHFEGRPLHRITKQDLAKYISLRRSGGAKDVTILTNEIACMSAMFNYAESIGLCEYRDIPNFKSIKRTLKRGPQRKRYLSSEEYTAILSNSAEHVKNIIIFAVETGMRKEEYLSLLWQDIDIRDGRIAVKDTKNGKDRNIPISNKAMEVLQQLLQKRNSEYVFSKNDSSRYLDFKKGFKKACERSNIKDLRIHDLRRTFGSWRLQGLNGKKLTAKEVSTILGHSSSRITEETYAFLDELKITL